MGRRPTEWRLRVLEILADGQWHDREPVVLDAMRLVPPGKAFRRGEQYRERVSTGERKRGSDDDSIRTGQRAYVSETIQTSLKSGVIEKRVENGVYQIRMAPETPGLKKHKKVEGVWAKVTHAPGYDDDGRVELQRTAHKAAPTNLPPGTWTTVHEVFYSEEEL
jgi:hypothetical protein